MATHAARGAVGWPRYNGVAVFLHWAIAVMIIGLLGSGIWMVDAIHVDASKADAIQVYQVHKSFGLTVLALSFLRLAWRVLHPAPPLPSGMSWVERAGSHLSHLAFYVFMIGAPMTGWAMVSVSPQAVPTFYFWLVQIPHLPMLATLAAAAKPAVETVFMNAHAIIGWLMLALLGLHVAAALKHHFVNRDTVLARMVPGVSPRAQATLADGLATHRGPTALRALGALLVLGLGLGGALTVVALDGASKTAAPAQTAPAQTAPAQTGAAGAPAVAFETGGTVWAADMAASAIQFSGENAGVPFEGRFDSWTAQIQFDPDRLAASEVVVVIDTASATIGDMMNDAAMVGADWFNAPEHPKAVFSADSFRAVDASAGQYAADGFLTIRGIEQPVALPFALTIDGDRATATAAIVLDRMAFDIGAGPDPDGAFVSLQIPLSITVVADRAE